MHLKATIRKALALAKVELKVVELKVAVVEVEEVLVEIKHSLPNAFLPAMLIQALATVDLSMAAILASSLGAARLILLVLGSMHTLPLALIQKILKVGIT